MGPQRPKELMYRLSDLLLAEDLLAIDNLPSASSGLWIALQFPTNDRRQDVADAAKAQNHSGIPPTL